MVDIYLLTAPNGKRYVGQAKCYTQSGKPHGTQGRFRQHCSESRPQFLIEAAIAKHGAANFKVQTLHTVSKDKADDAEKFAIVAYNSLAPWGYNLTTGGTGKGWYHNPETVQRHSERMRQEWASGKRDFVKVTIAKLATGRAHTIRRHALPLYIYHTKGKKVAGVECKVPGHPRKSFTKKCMTWDEKVKAAISYRDGLPDSNTASTQESVSP